MSRRLHLNAHIVTHLQIQLRELHYSQFFAKTSLTRLLTILYFGDPRSFYNGYRTWFQNHEGLLRIYSRINPAPEYQLMRLAWLRQLERSVDEGLRFPYEVRGLDTVR